MSLANEEELEAAKPRLAHWDVRLVLCVAFLFQLYSWWRLDGYQLADSVEYIERAQGFLFGHEVLGPSSVRSFAFSALFLPFYWGAEQLGIEDTRFLVYVFRLGTALLGLALCLSCMRLGARLGGRSAGLWTGLLIGANPIFLQYTISPVSGTAAALFVSLGLERCLTRGTFRFHTVGGLWLGIGFMMAYQTLPIAASIVLVMLARDRWRHFRTAGGTMLGFSTGMAGQVVVDKLSYGEWGSSIFLYIVENAGGIMMSILGKYLGMPEKAYELYNWIEEYHGRERIVADPAAGTFTPIQPVTWYLTNLPSAVVWSALLLLAFGILRSIRRPRWDTSLLIVCLAFNVMLLSEKPSKSFRLWLPLFPFLFPLCALGFAWLRDGAPKWLLGTRRAVATLAIVATPVLGIVTLNQLDTQRFGLFWRAADWVNATVENEQANGVLVAHEDPAVSPGGYGAGKIRVSASHHWGMFMRESPLTFLVKLPFAIDLWSVLDEEQKQRNIDKLLTLDWYIAHWPSLVLHPDWLEVVNRSFTVEAAFYEREADSGLAAVLVLKRKPAFGGADEANLRTFHSRFEIQSDADYRDQFDFAQPVDFVDPESGRRARLLGSEYQTLPGTGLGWVSYHWSSDLPAGHDWFVIDRITSPDGRNAWQNNHALANGLASFAELGPGIVLRESHLVVPGKDAYSLEKPFVPFGGEHLRGDFIPSELWIKVVRYDESFNVAAKLEPHDGRTGESLPTAPALASPAGWRTSADGLSRVGALLVERVPALAEEPPPEEEP